MMNGEQNVGTTTDGNIHFGESSDGNGKDSLRQWRRVYHCYKGANNLDELFSNASRRQNAGPTKLYI